MLVIFKQRPDGSIRQSNDSVQLGDDPWAEIEKRVERRIERGYSVDTTFGRWVVVRAASGRYDSEAVLSRMGGAEIFIFDVEPAKPTRPLYTITQVK